ncbi:hypothetical protein VCSRO164_2791 [Vibrio cholerae]|nr:hypothetical protein VCSRO164_2791 [Vibrio cholerae]
MIHCGRHMSFLSAFKNDFFLTVIIFLTPFLFLIQSPMAFAISACLFAFYLLFGGINKKIDKSDIFIFIFSFTLTVPVFIFHQHGVSHVFYFLLTLLTFFSARKSSSESPDELLILFRFIYWFFVFFSLIVYYVYRDISEPFSGLISGSSTNGIPSYLIVLHIAYATIYYAHYRRLPVIPAILTLIIAVLGIGRGSIYIAVMLLIASFFVNTCGDFKRKRIGSFLFFICLISVFIGLAMANFDNVYSFILNKTKALQGINDPYRMQIIVEYLHSLDWWQVIFGGKYDNTVIEALYSNNPHISFIRGHAYLGLSYLFFILTPPLFVFLGKLEQNVLDSFVYLFLISTLILRSISEPILFPTSLDYYYFFVLMICFRNIRHYKSIKKHNNLAV